MTKKVNTDDLLSLKDFADRIGTSMAYVSGLIAEPKIIPTDVAGKKFIDISKYPIKDWKKKEVKQLNQQIKRA